MDKFQLTGIKCNDETALKNKIINDRFLKKQIVGTLFRPLALCPLPAQQLPKVNELVDGIIKPVHQTYWERKAGKFSIELIGHKKYGIPFGQDIMLILFLAFEAKRQGSRVIRGNFYKNFIKMFDMEHGGKKYLLIKNGFLRIKESKFSWNDTKNKGQYTGENYIYIDKWNVRFDPEITDKPPINEQYIVLSERFWEEIINFPLPCNLDAIKYLKRKPACLMFYIWLSFRVWYAYHTQEKFVKINLLGKNGLQNQLSSRIIRIFDFRRQVIGYLRKVKEIWPKCPVEIERYSLIINVNSQEQLDIQDKPEKLFLELSWPPSMKDTKRLHAGNSSSHIDISEEEVPFEKIFRFYGAKGKKLKEALLKPYEQIKRNLAYFEIYIKKMKDIGKTIKNPGALLCSCVIEDYAKKSQFEFDEEEKEKSRKIAIEQQEYATNLTKQKMKEFRTLLDQKIEDRLASLPPNEREQIMTDFEDLVTQQHLYAEAYKKNGLINYKIKSIYRSFMGEKFLTENEQSFEIFMSKQGLQIVEN